MTEVNDIVLEMKDIHKSFGKLEVLTGIDLEVKRGEVVAIIGPSGGGKSTLLRCATTLEKIDSGKIVIGGDILCEDVDQGFRDISSYGEMREEIEVLEDKAELAANLFFEIFVAIYGAPVNVFTEDVAADYDLAGVDLFERGGAS